MLHTITEMRQDSSLGYSDLTRPALHTAQGLGAAFRPQCQGDLVGPGPAGRPQLPRSRDLGQRVILHEELGIDRICLAKPMAAGRLGTCAKAGTAAVRTAQGCREILGRPLRSTADRYADDGDGDVGLRRRGATPGACGNARGLVLVKLVQKPDGGIPHGRDGRVDRLCDGAVRKRRRGIKGRKDLDVIVVRVDAEGHLDPGRCNAGNKDGRLVAVVESNGGRDPTGVVRGGCVVEVDRGTFLGQELHQASNRVWLECRSGPKGLDRVGDVLVEADVWVRVERYGKRQRGLLPRQG